MKGEKAALQKCIFFVRREGSRFAAISGFGAGSGPDSVPDLVPDPDPRVLG